jgi:glucokinase
VTIYATIDLGGTKIAGALATAEGAIVVERTVPTHSYEGPRAVVERIGALVNALAAECGERPAALGMGIPGNANAAGEVIFLPNLAGNWRNVPARAWLEPVIGCPVALLNDVRLATLGELVYGHGMQTPTLAFFAIGTGIGGGFAYDGRLYMAANGANSEFGHHTIVPDGPRCGCGSRGCLETLCSGPAISAEGVRLLRTGQTTVLYEMVEGDAERVNPRTMSEAAAQGDDAVRDVLQRASEYLGIAVSNVIAFFHPPLVVLGGGVVGTGAIDFDMVRTTVCRRVQMFPVDDVRIEESLLGTRASMLGGIALAAQRGIAWTRV